MEKLLGDAFHGRTMCEGRSSGFERGKNGTIGDGWWRCGFKRIQSETTVREKMGRTLWWLATEMMEKLLGDADSRRRRWCGLINGDHLQGAMVWVQEDTEQDYSQREDGKNALVVATEMIVKILQQCWFRRPCAREDRIVNGDHLQGTMVWFEEDTERDYSQREDGKNALVVSDGDDGENPQATPIQGDDGVDLRG
jgi:hypothetical protein